MAITVNDRDNLLAASSPRTITTNESVSIVLSNPITVVTGDSTGTPINYDNTNNTITVVKNGTALSYGTTANTFSVSASIASPTGGVTLSAGSGSGTTYTIPSITYMSPTETSVKVTYTISVKDTEGIEYLFYTAQIFNKVKNGINGSSGAAGAAGTRGSLDLYIVGTGPISSAKADAAILAQTGSSAKVTGDMVTESDGSTYVNVLRWNGSAWASPGTVIDGSLIVTNSITAAKINTNGLSIKDANGNVIFSSGVPLSTNRISGLGSLATKSSVTTAEVTGLGALATLNSINTGYISGLGALATFNTVPSTYIESLAADKIIAGTLGAGVIYAGTISANNITSGTLNSLNINGGTIGIGGGYTPSGKAFEVNSGGVVWIDGLTCRLAIFQGASGAPTALQAYANNSNPGIIGIGASGGNAHAIRGTNYAAATGGLIGASNGYDFYAEGGGINFGPFTGSHDILLLKNISVSLGDILVDTGVAVKRNINNAICYGSVSSSPLQKGCSGVLAKVATNITYENTPSALTLDATVGIQPDSVLTHNKHYCSNFSEIKEIYDWAAMNSLGEGLVNVCGENGNLEIGDLIVTSSLPGKGMKQSDDIIRSYTVAKSREAVTFSSPTEVKLVSCIYLCG